MEGNPKVSLDVVIRHSTYPKDPYVYSFGPGSVQHIIVDGVIITIEELQRHAAFRAAQEREETRTV